jgi:hypothetical protein
MSPSHRGAQFLDEFKEFLAFLKSLWGILAGVSIFFPLSNVLVDVIPLQSLERDGAFAKLAPSSVTALATITTLFLILWTFSQRSDVRAEPERRAIRRQAAMSFGAGGLTLVLYLVGYFVTLSNAYAVWGWESQDPRHLLAEVPLLVMYVASFALVTRAFVLLGMLEFYSTERPSPRP